MLKLVLGRSGTGKTFYIREKLIEFAKENIDRRLILVVPDQLSFETERAMLNKAGPILADKIKVWSFSRLCDEVFKTYGGLGKKLLDDGSKNLIMSMAINECKDHLNVYTKSANKIISLLLNSVNEFKAWCISPEDLKVASSKLQGTLKTKMTDVALIYSAYEAIIANSYIDPADIFTMAEKILYGKGFFSNSIVAFDGFENFNKQKLGIITSALTEAELVYFSFCGESSHNSDQNSLFMPIHKTAAQITALARELGVEVSPPIKLKNNLRNLKEELSFLEQNLYSSSVSELKEESKDIRIFQAADVYKESEFVASKIRDLVMNSSYRYGDISIITRVPNKYYSVLGDILKKWNIPAYFSEPRRIDGEPLIRLVLSLFSVVSSSFSTDQVLSLLKTGLTGLSFEEVTRLENYIFTWRIKGKAWKSDFTKHPDGFGKELDESSQNILDEINCLRRRVIEPILQFIDKAKDATTREISSAIYEFLLDYNVDKTVLNNINTFTAKGYHDLANQGKMVWQELMDTLDRFANVMGSSYISISDYHKLLTTMLSKEEIQDIPLNLDTVVFGTADLLRPENCKVAFVIGAVQCDFPLVPQRSGIFTDKERNELFLHELVLDNSLEDELFLEKYFAYKALTVPSEKLFISYPSSYSGEDLSPSEVIESIKTIFPELKTETDIPFKVYSNSYASAFSSYAMSLNEPSQITKSFEAVLEEDEEYKKKISSLSNIIDKSNYQLMDEELSKEMFGGKYFSASQIEVYHRCKFQYFCKYGLNAREKMPAEINVMEYGTLMHYLFESILSADYSIYYNNRNALDEKIKELIKSYADTQMGGFNDLSPQDKYRFKRMSDTAVLLVERLIEELSQSEFEPKYFELALKNGTSFPPLKVKTSLGDEISIGGIIDRVDVYERDDVKYVRVVDYKTGKKEFKLQDVLFGLNLQMLIYLAALKEKTNLVPSGVLYMPSSSPSANADSRSSKNKAEKDLEKSLCMNGMVLDDVGIIRAMEKAAEGKFIPVSIKENGKMNGTGNLLKQENMDTVFGYIKGLVSTMADNLYMGKIEAQPLMRGQNSCAWCPYSSVCLNKKDDRDVEGLKISNSDAIEIMGKERKGDA